MPRDATATDKITPTDLTRIAERGSDPEWLSDPRATGVVQEQPRDGGGGVVWFERTGGRPGCRPAHDAGRYGPVGPRPGPSVSDRRQSRRGRRSVEHAGQVDAVARTIAALKADALKDDGSALASLAPLVAVIWQQLPADPLEVESLYRQAAEEGDATVVRAIEALPLTASWSDRARTGLDSFGRTGHWRSIDAALTG